jgi:hypothetical protein
MQGQDKKSNKHGWLLTWVTKDLSNGAALPRLALLSYSDAVDLSPFEYDFQGLLDAESSDGDCSDDLGVLDDRAGALQAEKVISEAAIT